MTVDLCIEAYMLWDRVKNTHLNQAAAKRFMRRLTKMPQGERVAVIRAVWRSFHPGGDHD